MANTEIDWTFEDAPADDVPPPARGLATPPKRRAPDRPRRSAGWLAFARRHRRLLAVVGIVLGLVAGGLLTAEVIGWQHLRDQLAHEIAYEDEQSRAGHVDAVQALQGWSSPSWRERRAAEVSVGLAAPLPAESLRPLAEPPQVLRVDVVGNAVSNGDFTASVARRYTDSAGQIYAFTLTQRYRNRGPGLWERQPPDVASLGPTEAFTGRRLSATYPEADAAWMQTALPQVDAYLTTACADWNCAPNARVQVTFTTQLEQLPRPHFGRSADEGAPAGGYPLIFDLPFRMPRYPARLVVPSPQMGGAPADAAASGALVRAYTADFLGQLAADLVISDRTQHRYFLDALVARMEIKLGLAPLPPRALTISGYIPVVALWPDLVGSVGADQPPELGPRLQALWFLNDVLADQPPTADAKLLAHMRWQPDLAQWLNLSLGVEGAAVIAAYEAEVQAQWAATPPDWGALTGLIYACDGTMQLVRAGGAQRLPYPLAEGGLAPLALAPDGQTLALVVSAGDFRPVQVFDAGHPDGQRVSPADGWPLGWAADGQLLTLAWDHTDQSGRRYTLERFDPRTGVSQRLQTDSVFPQLVSAAAWGADAVFPQLTPAGPDAASIFPEVGLSAWSADHGALGLTFGAAELNAQTRLQPGVLTLAQAAPASLIVPARQGHSPALSPDGRWLAYVTTRNPWAEEPTEPPSLAFFDLTTGTTYEVRPADTLPADALPPGGLVNLGELLWSPDGTRLAFLANSAAEPVRLFTLTWRAGDPTSGGDLMQIDVPAYVQALLGFSADGRYLAAYTFATGTASGQLLVFDSASGDLAFQVTSAPAAWSPQGHVLAVAGPGGVYSVEVATGAEQWIASGACVVSWSGVS